MAFGANLINSAGELLLTTTDVQYVYRGWLSPYGCRFQGNTMTHLEYLIPFLSNGLQLFFEEVNYAAGTRNQVPVQVSARPNPDGKTSLTASITTTTTATTLNFKNNSGIHGGFPGVKSRRVFEWVEGGNSLSGVYDTECVLEVGDVVWSESDPSNQVTITSLVCLSTFSATNSNLFQITFSGPLTFGPTASEGPFSSPSPSFTATCICAQKLVNTMQVVATVAAPINKMGEWRYPMRVFTTMDAAPRTGYGMQVFDAAGAPIFDTNRSILTLAAGISIPTVIGQTTKDTYTTTFGAIPSYAIHSSSPLGLSNLTSAAYDDNFMPWISNPGAYGLASAQSFSAAYRVMALRKTGVNSAIIDTTGSSFRYGGGTSPFPLNYRQYGNTYWFYADGNKYPIRASNRLPALFSRGTSLSGTPNYMSQNSDPPPVGWPSA